MNHTISSERGLRRRKAQALAEFALTLPLLLVLVFGTIEFGRLFQSWVTIQNAAREATRYATTGQYNTEKYDIEALLPCDPTENPEDPILPLDLRGTRFTVQPWLDDPDYEVQFYAASQGADLRDPRSYPLAPESLFATWYDGENCERSEDHLEKRRDILRVASIMDVARVGAAGLWLEANPLEDPTQEGLAALLYNQWLSPLPRSDRSGYLGVTICSGREMIDHRFSTAASPESDGRFYTVYEESPIPAEYAYGYTVPYCMLNEVRTQAIEGAEPALQNHGLRWLDAGGPGERVAIFVTYNHPLITPLGLGDYVPMQARRSGVNEAFRTSRALSSVLSGPPGVGIPTVTPLPPTDTPIPSDTPTATDTVSPTPSASPTSTPGPFNCDNLWVGEINFFQNRAFFQIRNENYQETELERIRFFWQRPANYPLMQLRQMAMNSDAHWDGQRGPGSPALDTGEFLQGTDEYADFIEADRRVRAGDTTVWSASFAAGPPNLSQEMRPGHFGGSEFYFFNPEGGPSCRIVVDVSNDPIENPDSPLPPPTDTPLPDCASENIRVEFDRFATFGVVVLQVFNDRNTVAPLYDFNIVWPAPSSLNPPLSPGVFQLAKVSAGGVDADDTQQGTLLWTGPDAQPDTRAINEGSFVGQGYTFPPGRTPLYLDFTGTSSTLSTAFGIHGSQFTGSWFNLGCGLNAPGEGPGGPPPSGYINLGVPPPPGPTNTPAPTNTPGPTLTPSPTVPTNTPSNTPTPGPTYTPTNTPTITPTVWVPPDDDDTGSLCGGEGQPPC
jgi:hypothetical protein